jgi:signal transduction histidine kinase
VLELNPTTLDALSWFVAATRVLLPVGFLLALLLAELRASAVQLALLEHLVTRPTPQQWRGAIAGVLDDPELRIGYRDPASGTFLEPDGGRLPEPGEGCARVPIDHDGEAVAAMVLDETLAEDPELVRASATATLVAIQNGALEGELRARVVQAGHVERLRIERDIHDSAQQRLAALRVHLALAGERVASSEDRAMLRRLNSEVELAIEELRDVTHGKVPAVLTERGLADAMEEVASASPIPVRVEADGLRRYSEAIETAIFFCCLECLQNATKHAGPQATVGVRLAERDGEVSFTVRDDGAGFDAGAVRSGAGLSNLAERVEALGGTLEVNARPGRGTRVTGRFPAGAERAQITPQA